MPVEDFVVNDFLRADVWADDPRAGFGGLDEESGEDRPSGFDDLFEVDGLSIGPNGGEFFLERGAGGEGVE